MNTLRIIRDSIQEYHKLLFPLFILALIAVSVQNKNDLDVYFIYENGRYIVENLSFPHSDWMSIHDGLHIVLQQWCVSIIDYLVASGFGETGLHILVSIVLFLIGFILYKTCVRTNNYFAAYSLPLFAVFLIGIPTGTPRPAIFSLLFISLMCFTVRHYLETSNRKYLIFVPILSILHSNFHSTFWIVSMGVLITYLVFSYKSLDRKDFKYFLLTILIAIIVGFINPYGYEAVFQAFYTIGYREEYSTIPELQPFTGINTILYIIIPLTIYVATIKDTRFNNIKISSLVLYMITMIGSILITRLASFMIVLWVFALIDNIEKCELPSIKEPNRIENKISVVICTLMSIITIIIFVHYNMNYSSLATHYNEFKEISQELSKEDNTNKTFFSTDVSYGQFLYHFNGMVPYIDGRAETYIKSLNGKRDIYVEFHDALQLFNLDSLFEEYEFDYLIVERYSEIHKELITNNTDYKIVFDSEDNDYIILKKT